MRERESEIPNNTVPKVAPERERERERERKRERRREC